MTKSKREKIISAIGFTVLLAIMAITLSLFFKPDNPMDYATKRTSKGYKVYDEPKNTLDVLFFGHSAVYSSVSPMEMYGEYGFTSFDCSYPGQMPWETADFLKEVITKQSPKVVVVDVDSLFYDIKQTDIKKYYDDTEYKRKYPLLQNHIAWKDWFPDENERERDCNKGYLINKKKNPYKGNKSFKKTEQRFAASQEHMKGLDNIVNFCQKKGIALYLIELPSPLRWNYSKFNTVSDYVKTRWGVEFIDLTQKESEMGIDWANDTRDKGDHLNHYGAVKVSRYLGKILTEKYNLPDRRNDENYAFWKEDYEAYKQLCNK